MDLRAQGVGVDLAVEDLDQVGGGVWMPGLSFRRSACIGGIAQMCGACHCTHPRTGRGHRTSVDLLHREEQIFRRQLPNNKGSYLTTMPNAPVMHDRGEEGSHA